MNKFNTIKKTSAGADSKSSDPLYGNIWKQGNVTDEVSIRDVVFGENIFVAVGENGVVYTSTDGMSWIAKNSGHGKSDHLFGVAYGGQKTFVAVGRDQLIVMSTNNGETWETVHQREEGKVPDLYKVAYGKGMYIAVNESGGIQVSKDGKEWEFKEGPAGNLRHIVFGGGKFVIGTAGRLGYVSSDGVSWHSITIGTAARGLCYYDGLWIATGHEIWTSEDALNWTRRLKLSDLGREKENLYSCVGAPSSYIAAGEHGMVFNSLDGIKWTQRESGTKRFIFGIAFGNELVAGVGNGGVRTPESVYLYSTHYSPAAGPETKTITITSPRSGYEWKVGENHDITWSSTGKVGNVRLEYSTDNGNTWEVFDSVAKNDGLRPWIVPDTPSDKCKIKITEVDDPTVFGITEGTFTIIELPLHIVVPVGTNTISDAVRGMLEGGVVELRIGTYTQTEPIVLPDHVTRFVIQGKGMGSTIIKCRNCHGIQQMMDTKIHQCEISGMTMVALETSTSCTGIKLPGNAAERSNNPNMIIRDIGFEPGDENSCWNRVIHIMDAFNPLIENVHVKGIEGNDGLKGSGILLQNCDATVISGGAFQQLEEAVRMNSCEGIKITNINISNVNKGINLRKNTLNVMLYNCNIDQVKGYALFEKDSELAGYHVINGGYFGFSNHAAEGGYLVWLQNDGSVVNGIIADGKESKGNGLKLGPAPEQEEAKAANMIRVLGCIFRNSETGIYLNGKQCIISGNAFENTVNTGIDGTEGWQVNNEIAANTGLD